MKKFIFGFLLGFLLLSPFFVKATSNLIERLKGRILLAVEQRGEAWYVTTDGTRIYMGSPANAWDVLRKYGLGINNKDLAQIPINQKVSLASTTQETKNINTEIKYIYVDRIVEKPVIQEKLVYKCDETNSPNLVVPEYSPVKMTSSINRYNNLNFSLSLVYNSSRNIKIKKMTLKLSESCSNIVNPYFTSNDGHDTLHRGVFDKIDDLTFTYINTDGINAMENFIINSGCESDSNVVLSPDFSNWEVMDLTENKPVKIE